MVRGVVRGSACRRNQHDHEGYCSSQDQYREGPDTEDDSGWWALLHVVMRVSAAPGVSIVFSVPGVV